MATNDHRKFTLGFSPCPNDTFIFDAIVHQRIDLKGYEFEFVIADVEELNLRAFERSIDITKISYYSFAQLTHHYQMMASGGALGSNCGPLLVANSAIDLENINRNNVAIPGINTTANVLCSMAYPELEVKEELLFSDIEKSVLDGHHDLGLIIHESRFTYEQKGLKKVADLGEWWQSKTNSPIPLGGICIQRSMPEQVKKDIEAIISASVQYAFDHPEASLPYTKQYAQEMDPHVMQAHIDLYVNEYSINLGEEGRNGVMTFLNHLCKEGIIDSYTQPIFV